ncbi:DNA ligase 1 [Marchantia polymorpha subsp. ruderalis]|uniref:DNA ligase n=2 Tax=Marchantia polymorpha TaxID=3197 RepID=A0AAF6AQF3_MARPO|nr:hypothetical protein MARPO_0033s0129 [Marchantia polymorpha]BBM98673.1 hypothetical protein Mp_1g15320 [Marchantia polymorpha subsp. ruderalis]|eukprot:PTQ41735.1 hypothetical protein MARPO_0033s0129 [Marchantia polymorpha]
MAQRTMADVLMKAAREKAGRAPASSKEKERERDRKEHEKKIDEEDGCTDSKSSKKPAAKVVPTTVDNFDTELSKSRSEFDPARAAFWKKGEQVPFIFLARALDLIANTTKRLAITEIICNVFRTVIATSPGDLLAVVYLSANKVAPAHEGVELGIGDAAIIKTLAEAYGRKEDQIKSQLKAMGDLGLVAKASRSTQRLMFKPPPLTCVKMLETFRVIAKEVGNQSMDKKRGKMKALLVAATDCEPLYVVRLLQSKLRIGLQEATVLVALGHAAVLSEQPPVPASKLQDRLELAAQTMKQVYSVSPVFEKIIPVLLTQGIEKLADSCTFTPGVPVGPMLAKPTKGVSEVLDKFQDLEFTCEYKYDGERAQIHYLENGSVEIYSRNAERNTVKFPDIVAAIGRYKKPEAASFVLDCEVVAYDTEKNKILPFQILSTRARKGVIISDIKVKVCIFAFDLLYINGRNLLNEQLALRREELYKSFLETSGEFEFATATNTRELDEMQKFLDAAINDCCEGLIVKTLKTDATYEPAKRSNNWLKLKKDYMDSVGDSLDLVPIGGYFGRGKRTGVYGAFLLACYDEDSEEYQSICKIGTGFSEQVLEERSSTLRNHIVDKPPSYYRYGDTLGVDVWFEPVEVWEVKAADLSISPVHKAANGLVDPVKGISLRFPRLIRLREDKTTEQATSAGQVAEMYRAQKITHQSKDGDSDED